MPTIQVVHKILGKAMICDQCSRLNFDNPDPTSIFIRCKGEIIEVSKVLIAYQEEEVVCKTQRIIGKIDK